MSSQPPTANSSSQDHPGKASRGRAFRFAAGLAITLVVLALVWSAAFFYVPPLLSHYAGQAAADQLGRRLTLGKITFNPWTLELTVGDVALAGATDGAPPQFTAGRVYVNAAAESIWRLAPVIDRLEIDAPRLRVSRLGDGRYDFDDILRRLGSKPAEPDKPRHAPAKFALYNVVVQGGEIDFTDVPLRTSHRIRDLQLALPMLSSLAAQREVAVEPRLAFTLDGNRFHSGASATPFAERGDGKATLAFERFDLAPFFGYLPAGLPLQPKAALLSADLQFKFAQRPTFDLSISGTLRLDDARLTDTASHELLDVDSLKVAIDALRPLQKQLELRRIDIAAPHVVASRGADGHIEGLPRSGSAPVSAAAKASSPRTSAAASAAASVSAAGSASASAAASAPAPSPAEWRVKLAALSVKNGKLDWRDATTAPAAALDIEAFSLDAEGVAWPLAAPVPFTASGRFGPAAAPGTFKVSGRAGTGSAAVDVGLDAVPLLLARPYLAGLLAQPLSGLLSADVAIDWQAQPGPLHLTVDAKRIALADLVLGEADAPQFSADRIEASDAKVDLAARSVVLGRLALQAPSLRVERSADRTLNVSSWVAPGRTPTTATASASASAPAAGIATTAGTAAAVPAWKLAVAELAVDKGRVGLLDRVPASPVALDIADLSLRLRGWSLDAAAATQQDVPFELSATLTAPADPAAASRRAGVAGRVEASGMLKTLASGVPSSAQAAVNVEALPLHRLWPYAEGLLNIDLRSALAGFKGDVSWQAGAAPAGAADFSVRGDASIDDVRVNAVIGAAAGAPASAASAADASADSEAAPAAAARPAPPQRGARGLRLDGSPGRQLLAWKSLAIRGVDVAVAPGKATRIKLGDTALTDFSARVVLDENGKLNLQEVTPGGGAANAVASAAGAASAAGDGAPAAPGGSPSSASTPPGQSPVIEVGPITFVNGRVAYNDRFVKPNYNADLSELNGKLGAFSSAPPAAGVAPQLAEVALTGKVEGTASLEINGKVNPLARPLALDIAAKVRDLELPPLTPYAVKYAGYGIERGKMSADVAYLVLPNGKLTASNRIVLNQLAFGAKVEGAPASLPVKLAVALLADRSGKIDLDLPLSGSINDPQFSVSDLIWKALGNLIGKAVTAPFTLLASVFGGGGGGGELSTVEFAPGMATLDSAAKASLDKVAKALVERPKLALTVKGEAATDVERDAWKRERLNQLLRAEKRRQAVAGGAPADAEVTVSDSERPALLAQVFKRSELAGPAVAASGAARGASAGGASAASKAPGPAPAASAASPETMETLLLANIAVSDEAMRQLAVRRAVNVRDYLAAKNLPTSRLFLGTPKAAPHEAGWVPRADLELAVD